MGGIRLYRIPIGRKNLNGSFGLTDAFISVLAISRKQAKIKARKYLKKGQSILR